MQTSDENFKKNQLLIFFIIGLLIDLIPNSPHYNIMRIVWQTVRRITNEILGVKGFKDLKTHLDSKSK